MAQLKEAEIIIILVSPDFVASDYCFKKELQIALERSANGRAAVIPVYIRPTDIEDLPFEGLKWLPYGRKPVSTWGDADEAWLDISQGIREHLADRVSDLTPRTSVEKKSKGVAAHLAEGFDYLQARYAELESSQINYFGVKGLDELTDGISQRELALVAGRPDHGHVEVALGAVVRGAVSGERKILVLSQRMSAVQYTNRLLCLVGLVDRFRFSRGQLEDEDWARVVGAIRILRDKSITVDDDPIRSPSQLKEKLHAVIDEGFDLIVIDGLEYIPNKEKHERDIAISLRDFAQRSGAAVLATLALGADFEERVHRRPLLVDLKEWRVLENYADKIVFCVREGIYSELFPPSSMTMLVMKTPHAVTGEVGVLFLSSYGGIFDEKSKEVEAT